MTFGNLSPEKFNLQSEKIFQRLPLICRPYSEKRKHLETYCWNLWPVLFLIVLGTIVTGQTLLATHLIHIYSITKPLHILITIALFTIVSCPIIFFVINHFKPELICRSRFFLFWFNGVENLFEMDLLWSPHGKSIVALPETKKVLTHWIMAQQNPGLYEIVVLNKALSDYNRLGKKLLKYAQSFPIDTQQHQSAQYLHDSRFGHLSADVQAITSEEIWVKWLNIEEHAKHMKEKQELQTLTIPSNLTPSRPSPRL